jgi:hypothetical protein
VYFAPKSGTADDITRFSFLKEIMQLGCVILTKEGIAGYALILTNVVSFLLEDDGSRGEAEFHMDQEILHETREWKKDSSDKIRERTGDSVTIKGHCSSNWCDYGSVPEIDGGEYKYLLIKIAR